MFAIILWVSRILPVTGEDVLTADVIEVGSAVSDVPSVGSVVSYV